MRHLCTSPRNVLRGPASLPAALVILLLCGVSAPLAAQQAAKSPRSKTKAATSKKTAPARRVAKPAVKPAAEPAAKPVALTPEPVVQPASDESTSYNVSQTTNLRSAPDAAVLGQLRAGTTVQVLARSRGWVRVRTDGWVRESELTPADTLFRANLSAADMRANPASARGKTVQWDVEFLAVQTADPLRHGLADGEVYMLARGPGNENALMYLVLPPSLVGTARALESLARISVTARVREGRSEPVGVPILDVQSIRRIQ